jgi:NADH-quinone oxidoreductase subunit A
MMLENYVFLIGLVAVVVFVTIFIWATERLLHKMSSGLEAKVADLKKHAQPAWRRYHIHYYIYALLFLAFDMEMAFMYPWAVVFKQTGLEAFVDMGVFLLVLLTGLLYAWSQKGLQRQ